MRHRAGEGRHEPLPDPCHTEFRRDGSEARQPGRATPRRLEQLKSNSVRVQRGHTCPAYRCAVLQAAMEGHVVLVRRVLVRWQDTEHNVRQRFIVGDAGVAEVDREGPLVHEPDNAMGPLRAQIKGGVGHKRAAEVTETHPSMMRLALMALARRETTSLNRSVRSPAGAVTINSSWGTGTDHTRGAGKRGSQINSTEKWGANRKGAGRAGGGRTSARHATTPRLNTTR